MSISDRLVIEVSAVVRRGSVRADHVGRRVTAGAGDDADTIRKTVTLALREVSDELKELIQ